jgi:ApaG protein
MNTPQVEVKVQPDYIPEQSDPEHGKYFFSYTISICNLGEAACQLRSRHWLITDSDGNKQEVRGEGVVGKQPLLNPGSAFTYTSGVLLDTAVGTMQGTYHMVDDGNQPFDVAIEPFLLALPGKIN